jgi:hypothetical protein
VEHFVVRAIYSKVFNHFNMLVYRKTRRPPFCGQSTAQSEAGTSDFEHLHSRQASSYPSSQSRELLHITQTQPYRSPVAQPRPLIVLMSPRTRYPRHPVPGLRPKPSQQIPRPFTGIHPHRRHHRHRRSLFSLPLQLPILSTKRLTRVPLNLVESPDHSLTIK